MAGQKTFYLETFGCQMNVHDSEKVIGTLEQQGYTRVETEEAADLILYNTCSIRDKAEQKVFHRLNDYKALYKQGKRFGVLGCVAQQEGERIFERAPYVSLVSGSASYRRLPEMLVQIEQGARKPARRASQGSTTARPTRHSRPSSPRGRIPIADTSPLSRAVTSSAPTVWSPTPAARSAAASLTRYWPRRATWPRQVTPKSNCSARM
jgi:tRNA-2-methylthio-N6-dimethylallyladenosine synthase